MRGRTALCLACVLAAATAALAAQPPSAQGPASGRPAQEPLRIEVGVDVVSVTAVVFGQDGKLVHGLGASDVRLLEDGVPQDVSYFREASNRGDPAKRVPLSVVLVLDTSRSMRPSLRFLQEAVLGFVYKLEDADQALLVSFNESVKGSAEFTGDTDRLERSVEGLQAWGGTSLHDATDYALGRIRNQPGRKAVVVFSDGADTTSALKAEAVVDDARAVEATVYCVGFKGQTGFGIGGPGGFLRKIASETGGRYFSPGNVGDLIKIFDEISTEIENHYLLAYTPKRAPDGTWRRIELKVDRPGAVVRMRKGYFAMARKRAGN